MLDEATKQLLTSQGLFIENLSLELSDRLIIQNLNLHINCARFGIIGRNGSGKSTLIRLIAGLLSPQKGRLLLDGIDPAKDRAAALQTVGILFQNPDHQLIFPTVEEELAFGPKQQGLPKDEVERRIDQVLTIFGKENWRKMTTHALSQGQKHLVCLMTILVMRPSWILLDEPFAGLDIPTKMHLRRHLAQCGARLIHVSHDPEDLRNYDHVAWVDAGHIVLNGAAEKVLTAYCDKMRELGADHAYLDIAD